MSDDRPDIPEPINDNEVAPGPDRFERLWALVAGKRRTAIEARATRLEKRHLLQVVGGSDFEADVASIRRELAIMNVQVASYFGIPVPDLPNDFGAMSDVS